ncbi:MAG: protein-disulfide reductase DsbD domain-containing protein [Pseudomonadota bacterium]
MANATFRGAGFAIAMAIGAPGPVQAAGENAVFGPWEKGHASRARLLVLPKAKVPVVEHAKRVIGRSVGPTGGVVQRFGQAVAVGGIQIEMTDGYKTYWRHPGTAGGVPPEMDWSRSTNVRSVNVGFPAPRRYRGDEGYSIGYVDAVILPLVAEPIDPSSPMELRLGFFYGVCKEICIPAEGRLSVNVPALRAGSVLSFGLPKATPRGSASSGPNAIAAARLVEAVYEVPAGVEPSAGQTGPGSVASGGADKTAATVPHVVSSRVETKAGAATLLVEVDFGADAVDGDVFAEAVPGVFVGSVSQVSKQDDRRGLFAIALPDGLPASETGVTHLDVTVVASNGSSVQSVPLRD